MKDHSDLSTCPNRVDAFSPERLRRTAAYPLGFIYGECLSLAIELIRVSASLCLIAHNTGITRGLGLTRVNWL
jgi:hypothetical protein